MENKKILIAGAGSIGCFTGGLLHSDEQAHGRSVTFFGRGRMVSSLATDGLHLTDYSGIDIRIPSQDLAIETDPACLANADLILVCVKGGATRDMADLIAKHGNPKAIVASYQNGLRNAEILREILPSMDIRAAMVPFNVVPLEGGRFHRATSGDIVVEAGQPDIAGILNANHLKTTAHDNMPAILRGKLLLNLNNALNALSDMPLVEQLGQRPWRVKMAAQIDEALAVFKAEGITPIPPSPLPAWLMPHILRLPTPLFRRIAKKMLAMDPEARTSMSQDIRQGRKTEIEDLQGEIVRMAAALGLSAPGNQTVMEEIKAIESQFD